MSEEKVARFECSGCGDGFSCRSEYRSPNPALCKPPENCLYKEEDEDRESDWKRVEQSTEGDSMKHVPVIYENSEAEEKKTWEYNLEIDGGSLEVTAVDSKTGERLAFLFGVNESGLLRCLVGAEGLLTNSGYSSQGLQFDDCNRVKRQ